MKKVLSLFMSIVMLLSITAGLNLTASADEEDIALTYGDYEYSINDDNTVEITKYTGSATNLDILSTIDGKSVTSIGSYAFDYCRSLTSVKIPNSVTSIGYWAFDNCTSLTSINVEESNANYSSQDGVLFNKEKTTLIQYPIGNAKTSYDIPNSVTSIGWVAFYYCTSLTSITIPNSVTSIGEDAFSGCTSLTSINVEESNANYSSQDGVLFNKEKTTLIQCPIGNARTSYSIPNSVTSIGNSAFKCCTSLTSVTIPNSVTSIGYYAFSDCTSLTSITIPDSVTSISDSAFSDCRSLTSVTIPNSVTSIGYYAFFGCTSLTDVYYTGTEAQWNRISITNNDYYLKNATIHYSGEPGVDPTPMPDPTPTPEPAPTPSNEPTTQSSTPAIRPTPAPTQQPASTQVPTNAPTTVAPASVEPTTVPQTTAPNTVDTTQSTTKATTKPATKTTKSKEVVNKKQKKAKFKKVTPAKASLTITWAKVKGVRGYEIQLATDKKFKKNKKTVTIKKQKTTKTTVKKLKAKKKYFVRIRTYKTKKIKGKNTKVYSSWSKAKTVKTK
jgi:hypothetical protein